MMRGLVTALAIIGLYFVLFPYRRNNIDRHDGFMSNNEKPFEPDNGDPWDNIGYMRPKFLYPGATDFKPVINSVSDDVTYWLPQDN
jgi:hypothetical protein